MTNAEKKERISVPADEKLAGIIWRLVGLSDALEALGVLGGGQPKSVLPGFSLATALIEKEAAEQRAAMSGAVYRAAAKAGHDVSRALAIYTNIKDGKPQVEIEFMDLADMAEDRA